MKTSSPPHTELIRPYGSTAEFAAQNLVKPQSVRKQYCLKGSYFGVRPQKLPNGRLCWPLG